MTSVQIPVLHFNDVYRVRQKVRGSEQLLGADQFAAKINEIRQTWHEKGQECQRAVPNPPFQWEEHQRRDRNGLCIFSGDLFNPSVESSITRGAHMVPVVNAMQVDAAHDWDFGYPHLYTLMGQTNFPWLFANVVDASWRPAGEPRSDHLDARDKQIEGTLPYITMVVKGVKVGIIGLVEEEWLETVPGFPEHFEYRSMVEVARKLSKELREGSEQCELIIAATHCRIPNDVLIANELGAVKNTDANEHGVDLVLGGHDHVYYVSRGVDTYEGDDFCMDMPGTENDRNTYMIKSGTDFHDLSEVELTLSAPQNAVRRRTITGIRVKRHTIQPSDPTQPELKKMLDNLMDHVSKSVGQPVAYTLTPWDARASNVRMEESPLGDFLADILLISIETMLRMQKMNNKHIGAGERVADCCLICGGSLRGDSVFGPGEITLSNILEIMPFEDPIVVKELTGQQLWDALENGFSQYPKQEGRFPQIAGMRVVWDSSKEPFHRVVSVDFLRLPFDGKFSSSEKMCMKIRNEFEYTPSDETDDDVVTVHRVPAGVKEPLQLDKKYNVVTRGYLANGNDGYTALMNGEFVVNFEAGELMSTIVRKYLLGASYIYRFKQLRERMNSAADTSNASTDTPSADTSIDSMSASKHLSAKTDTAVQRAYDLCHGPSGPKTNGASPLVIDNSFAGIREALFVAGHEHHSMHDTASQKYTNKLDNNNAELDAKAIQKDAHSAPDNLAVVIALADGRMVDQARQR